MHGQLQINFTVFLFDKINGSELELVTEYNSSNIVGVIDASEGSDFIDSIELEIEK